MTAAEFLQQLDGVRRTSRGWVARCPAHDDRSPSLSIAEGDRGLLMKCWAGCTVKEICAALGVNESDLFFDGPRSPRQRASLPPRPRSVDWRIVSNDQLHRRDAIDWRTARTLAAATGVNLSQLTDQDTDAMLNAVADAYHDRDLADRLEHAAFQLREQGIREERTGYALRHASNS